MRGFLASAVLLVAASIIACGGGGGGGSSGSADPGNAAVTITGYVLIGPVGGASVQLQSVDRSGTKSLLATTTSAADGSYSFRASPPSGSTFLVTANGGQYKDPAAGTTLSLGTALRAAAVWSGQTQRVTLTGYSEAVVRTLEGSAVVDWSSAAVSTAEGKYKDWLGLSTLTDFKPVDLLVQVDPSTDKADIANSLMAGVFSSFAKRVDAKPTSSLASALNGIHYLVSLDRRDDRLFPAFLGGFVDFIDLSSLSAEAKLDTKRRLLLQGVSNTSFSGSLTRAMPTGVSSGSSSAPMANDVVQIMGNPQGHTEFNKRGALVGFTQTADKADWHRLYSASVADVYGDGDVGIGRWNGGTYEKTIIYSGGSSEPYLVALGNLHYAVAKPPSDVPSCGTRRLALVAATEPTDGGQSYNQRLITGLTPDSAVSFQYLNGGIQIGADIGVYLPSGSVLRYRTNGGVDAPWAGRSFTSGPNQVRVDVAPQGTPPAGSGFDVFAQVSGVGATKLVATLSYPYSDNATSMSAVFAAPAGTPDTANCGAPGGVSGAGISSLPSNGEQFAFVRFNGEQQYLGAPVNVTFGTDGALASMPRALSFSAPAYELHGNAYASIGRVNVTGTVSGAAKSRLVPYGVALPGAVVPTSGTVAYDLLAATSVVPDDGSPALGTVSSASFQITYGQYPQGTPNPYYGTSQLLVNGTMGGSAFVVSDPGNPAVPSKGRMVDVRFSADYDRAYQGAVSGQNADYAVVAFNALAFGAPVNGMLLFKKRQ